MAIIGKIIKKGIEIRQRVHLPRYSPERAQRRVLRQLIRKAQFTLFGEVFHFTSMVGSRNFMNKFRATVPVYDYDTIFSEWWNKCLHNEENVCWPGRVKYF